jgi:hypothetical protein
MDSYKNFFLNLDPSKIRQTSQRSSCIEGRHDPRRTARRSSARVAGAAPRPRLQSAGRVASPTCARRGEGRGMFTSAKSCTLLE